MKQKFYKKKELILWVITLFLVGLVAGYAINGMNNVAREYIALDWCVDTGIKILQIKGYDIEVDKTIIKTAVGTYYAFSQYDNDNIFKNWSSQINLNDSMTLRDLGE